MSVSPACSTEVVQLSNRNSWGATLGPTRRAALYGEIKGCYMGKQLESSSAHALRARSAVTQAVSHTIECPASAKNAKKWLRKSEQGDKWNRCLIEGMIVALGDRSER